MALLRVVILLTMASFTIAEQALNDPNVLEVNRIHLDWSATEMGYLEEEAKYFSNQFKFSRRNKTCGQSNTFKSDRIIGGIETKMNEFPWQALIVITEGGFLYGCGGSLISDQWILTAAHCVDKAEQIYVILGAHFSNVNASDPNRRVYSCSGTVIHPTWDEWLLTGDIALVQLSRTIPFDDYVSPICLPSIYEPDHVGDNAVITGWGRTSDSNRNISEVLRKANLTVITQAECVHHYSHYITDQTLCTRGLPGLGACNGDSGGPLSFVRSDGTHVQIGIVSFGSSRGCQASEPSVFTRITSYLNWIAHETGMETSTGSLTQIISSSEPAITSFGHQSTTNVEVLTLFSTNTLTSAKTTAPFMPSFESDTSGTEPAISTTYSDLCSANASSNCCLTLDSLFSALMIVTFIYLQ